MYTFGLHVSQLIDPVRSVLLLFPREPIYRLIASGRDIFFYRSNSAIKRKYNIFLPWMTIERESRAQPWWHIYEQARKETEREGTNLYWERRKTVANRLVWSGQFWKKKKSKISLWIQQGACAKVVRDSTFPFFLWLACSQLTIRDASNAISRYNDPAATRDERESS